MQIDKPSKPLGPLRVEAVFKDRCHLTWRAPKDDGGMEILYYQVEAMDVKTGKWMKVGEVQILINLDARLNFVDSSDTNKRYNNIKRIT